MLKSIFYYLSILLLLNGCTAFHTGIIQSSAAITNANFKILGTVKGESLLGYFLGIGGFTVEGLVSDAKNDIYKQYTFPAGVCLGNITVDFISAYYPFYFEKKAIITADVIDFNMPSTLNLKDFKNKTIIPTLKDLKFKSSIHTINDFVLGDSVRFAFRNSITTGVVTKIFKTFNILEIKFTKEDGKQKTIEIDVTDVKKD